MKPGAELIRELEKLRKLLNQLTGELNSSGVARTAHFLNYVGNNCSYYRKSLDLFLDKDYDKLRDRIRDCADLFDVLDGRRRSNG
jgi:hypothetical protein